MKWLLPSSGVAIITGAARYVYKRSAEARERRILDLLEQSGQPVSVGIIQNEFIKHVLRDVKSEYLFNRLKLGGYPENEADHLPPKRSIWANTRHWWRVNVKRELPTEEKVRDILRSRRQKALWSLSATIAGHFAAGDRTGGFPTKRTHKKRETCGGRSKYRRSSGRR